MIECLIDQLLNYRKDDGKLFYTARELADLLEPCFVGIDGGWISIRDWRDTMWARTMLAKLFKRRQWNKDTFDLDLMWNLDIVDFYARPWRTLDKKVWTTPKSGKLTLAAFKAEHDEFNQEEIEYRQNQGDGLKAVIAEETERRAKLKRKSAQKGSDDGGQGAAAKTTSITAVDPAKSAAAILLEPIKLVADAAAATVVAAAAAKDAAVVVAAAKPPPKKSPKEGSVTAGAAAAAASSSKVTVVIPPILIDDPPIDSSPTVPSPPREKRSARQVAANKLKQITAKHRVLVSKVQGHALKASTYAGKANHLVAAKLDKLRPAADDETLAQKMLDDGELDEEPVSGEMSSPPPRERVRSRSDESSRVNTKRKAMDDGLEQLARDREVEAARAAAVAAKAAAKDQAAAVKAAASVAKAAIKTAAAEAKAAEVAKVAAAAAASKQMTDTVNAAITAAMIDASGSTKTMMEALKSTFEQSHQLSQQLQEQQAAAAQKQSDIIAELAQQVKTLTAAAAAPSTAQIAAALFDKNLKDATISALQLAQPAGGWSELQYTTIEQQIRSMHGQGRNQPVGYQTNPDQVALTMGRSVLASNQQFGMPRSSQQSSPFGQQYGPPFGSYSQFVPENRFYHYDAPFRSEPHRGSSMTGMFFDAANQPITGNMPPMHLGLSSNSFRQSNNQYQQSNNHQSQ